MVLLDELGEEREVLWVVAEQFRMPLHTEHIRRVGNGDCFDVAVVTAGRHLCTFSQNVEHLMMETVDPEIVRPDDLFQGGPFDHLDAMNELIV